MAKVKSFWLSHFDSVITAAELELEDKAWFLSCDIFKHMPELSTGAIYGYLAQMKNLGLIIETEALSPGTKQAAKLVLSADYKAIRQKLIDRQKTLHKTKVRKKIGEEPPKRPLPIRALLDQSLDCVEKLEELLPALKKALLDLHKNLAAFEDIRKILGNTREVVARAPTVS